MEREAAALSPRDGEVFSGAYERSDYQKVIRLLGVGGVVPEPFIRKMILLQSMDAIDDGKSEKSKRARSRAFKNLMSLGKTITDSKSLSGGHIHLHKHQHQHAESGEGSAPIPPVESNETVFETYDRLFPEMR